MPELGSCKGTRDIEHEHAADGVLEVGGYKTLEFLLSSGIPQLEAADVALELNVLADKVHPDGRLSASPRTLKKSSKRLLANLSMSAVLPTPLSPRKMILCVFLEILELLEADINITRVPSNKPKTHPPKTYQR